MGKHLPDVSPVMRTWQFWVNKGADSLNCNLRPLQVTGGLDDLEQVFIADPIDRILPDSPSGYLADGERWSDPLWQEVVANVAGAVEMRAFGFTVRRANLRIWPTDRPCYRSQNDREFDQFQETRIHLFEPLTIGLCTQDQKWVWVRSKIASGWMHAEDVGVANAIQWERYRDQVPRFLVVIANGVRTEAQPYDSAVSFMPIEYGACLPLFSDSPPEALGHQNVLGHYVVEYPVRQADGSLDIRLALINQDDRVHVGFLASSRANLIRSIFSLLGDRYAWGDLLGGHDCSSLVMDAYRTLGIHLPRNSRDQAQYLPARSIWNRDDDARQRMADLALAEPGDLLMMPGHVLMFLGIHLQLAYALHAFVGYGETINGVFQSVWVNSVEVSSLRIPTRSGPSYLSALTRIVHVW